MESKLEYKLEKELGSGTFGYVFLAHDQNGKKYAIKRLRKNSKNLSREIEILQSLKNSIHTVQLVECFYSENNKNSIIQNMVFEYFPNDMYNIIKKYKIKNQKIPIEKIKLFTYQLFKGLQELKNKYIIHRDIKPENILVDNNNLLKICDFGAAKFFDIDIKSSPYVVSQFFRAPELFLCSTDYNEKIDIWAVGCILGELLTLDPIFKGDDEGDQFFSILRILGDINKEDVKYFLKKNNFLISILGKMPSYKQDEKKIYNWVRGLEKKDKQNCLDLLVRIFKYNPQKRITVKAALDHPFFKNIIADYHDLINHNN